MNERLEIINNITRPISFRNVAHDLSESLGMELKILSGIKTSDELQEVFSIYAGKTLLITVHNFKTSHSFLIYIEYHANKFPIKKFRENVFQTKNHYNALIKSIVDEIVLRKMSV